MKTQRLNLLTGSGRTSPETQTHIWTWLRQPPHSTPVVHSPVTAYKEMDRSCYVYQGPTKRRHSRQLMLGRSRGRNTFTEIFRKPPDENMMNIARWHWRSEVEQTELSTTVPVFWSCPKLTEPRQSLWCFSKGQHIGYQQSTSPSRNPFSVLFQKSCVESELICWMKWRLMTSLGA